MVMDRPKVGSLTVPYIVDESRSPIDFRELDADHVARCARQRRCGVCGARIRKGPLAFIGPDDRRRCFADPWMHPACARIAAVQCPFLAGRRTWREKPDGLERELLAPYVRMVTRLAPDGRSHVDGFGHWHFEAIG